MTVTHTHGTFAQARAIVIAPVPRYKIAVLKMPLPIRRPDAFMATVSYLIAVYNILSAVKLCHR